MLRIADDYEIGVEFDADGVFIVVRDSWLTTEHGPLTPEQAKAVARELIEAAEAYANEYPAACPRPAQLHPA